MWPVYSMVMSFVTVWALILVLRGRPAQWNKGVRTGVVGHGEPSLV
jgi:hypothetical protein